MKIVNLVPNWQSNIGAKGVLQIVKMNMQGNNNEYTTQPI